MLLKHGSIGLYKHLLGLADSTSVHGFTKRDVIYDEQRPATGLYLVILGRVNVTSAARDGAQSIGRIVCPDELFGEFTLIGGASGSETAVAMENVTLMSWSREEIERQIEREPALGLALTQYMVERCIELQKRINAMAIQRTPERVMLGLIHLADSLGTPMPDGSTRIPAVTHRTLAEFIGTSREIVTLQFNRLRRLGMLDYSRRFIDIHVGAIVEALREQGVHVSPRGTGLPASSAGMHF